MARARPVSAPRLRMRRLVNIPLAYLGAIPHGTSLFSPLYQFENGLRLMIHHFLVECYGDDWWNASLKGKLPDVHSYAERQKASQGKMPWIGASAAVEVLPIHLVTLGHLEEIVKSYQSECIPELFPNLTFFLGHMECIKRVRNIYSHMFPCLTQGDVRLARREIRTLTDHINARL